MKNKNVLVIAVATFSVVGLLVLAVSLASGQATSVETETTQLSKAAEVHQDSGASNGEFVRFNQNVTNPGDLVIPIANTVKDAVGASVILDAFPNYETWLGRDLEWRVTFYKYYLDPANETGSYDYRGAFNDMKGWNDVRQQEGKPYQTIIQSIGLVPNDLKNAKETCGSMACNKKNLIDSVNGEFDSLYRRIAQDVKDAGMHELWPNGKPRLIIRLGYELNGEWFAWSSVGAEQEYAAAYRHAQDVMTGVFGDGVGWEWNVSSGPGIEAARVAWPGDEYVDVVGLDFYDRQYGNSFECRGCPPIPVGSRTDSVYRNHWENLLRDGMQPVFDFAIQKDKAFGISEWGASTIPQSNTRAGEGGNNPLLMQQVHDWLEKQTISGATNDNWKRLAYFSYFERGKRDLHKLSPGSIQQVPDEQGVLVFDFGGSTGVDETDYPSSNTRRGAAEEYLRLFGGN